MSRLLALAASLAILAGCEGLQQKPPAEQDARDIALFGECSKTNTRGTVSLTFVGNPGDAFKVTLRCGGQVVSWCSAVIAPGANQASCNAGPNPVPQGARDCSLGQGMKNSPAANARTWGCG
jgi:hypothetical protein